MAAAIGWYGPLIDLCKASSHIGGYVQLIVFVHKSTPVQYKIARNGGEVVRMDILVGDETRSYFPVTIWQKQMGSQVLAGHVFLFQNFKITKFGDAIEARTIHCSSLKCLLQTSDFSASKGWNELLKDFRLGIMAREKLQKVFGWVQRAGLAQSDSARNYYGEAAEVNWKVQEDLHSQDCSTLSELVQCQHSCKASFHASVGEVFLPITGVNLQESEAERMFVSRRIHKPDGTLIDDFITTGCQLCGAPVNARFGATAEQQNSIPLYCQKSSDRLHIISTIYRPFLLYVWDESTHLPMLVSNKAAELLFGNISAEKVYTSYKSQQKLLCPLNCIAMTTQNIIQTKDKRPDDGNPNFYMIWLILLNMLLQHGKNRPLKFKAIVDTNREWDSGRFEMETVTIPAFLQISLV